jgi:two-component system, OmpR family, response regulator
MRILIVEDEPRISADIEALWRSRPGPITNLPGMEELAARVRALIRRSAGQSNAVIQAGTLQIDTRQMRVYADEAQVQVSPLEYRLLSYFMHHKGRVVPVSELVDHLYGDDDAREANALEALIMRLRRKLGSGAIETRRGFGYVISDPGETA